MIQNAHFFLAVNSEYINYLFRAKLPSTEYTNCILTGKRYTADEGHLCGIIHRVFPGDELLDSALTVALHLAKENFDRHTLKELKRGLYYLVLKAINDDIVFYAKL
jgi:enoyl-CoA hydratase/carnithine racemase